ncbi:MAG: hypothetical protein ABEI52_11295 [Halobacteriaceae archaeon]
MFTSRIEAVATEFGVAYSILAAIDDGLTDVETIRDRVFSNVNAASDDQANAGDEAIERLIDSRF